MARTGKRAKSVRGSAKKAAKRGDAISAVKRPARRATLSPQAVRELEGPHIGPGQMNAMRDLFWCNVVRDMLNGLAVLGEQQPEMLDGRVGLLTRRGQRIPVAGVAPLFACSIPGSGAERDASVAVQCTVFQITTPEGEVFTLPVHEIRGVHTMTQELLEKLQKVAEEEERAESDSRPFGLAAFAALPKPKPATGPGMMEGLGE